MINVTEKAVEKIQEALKEKGENPAIRVYIAGSG
jgi:Fe-S cluster assembly iron-binding protein IscA